LVVKEEVPVQQSKQEILQNVKNPTGVTATEQKKLLKRNS